MMDASWYLKRDRPANTRMQIDTKLQNKGSGLIISWEKNADLKVSRMEVRGFSQIIKFNFCGNADAG